VSALLDNNNTTHLEDYTYLGVSTIVQRSHPEVTNTLTLSYITAGTTGASGDQYTGLDSFGRVIDQYFSINSGATTTDRFQYGYDQDSNVLYKKNAGPNGGSINASTMSELYHVNSSATGDNATAYDGLNRLTDFARGTLSASGNNGTSPDTINTPATSSNWHLDALGNWTDSSSVASGTTGTDLTTAKTLGTAQNAAASGWYGEQITVATTDDLAVTQLGRIFITGNSSSHTVKIVDAATGLDVPGASVSVPTGGTNGQFTFVTLNRPVTLLAGHSYYVVSQETSGGDQWYDSTTTVTTTTAVSAKVSASYVASTWSTGSSGHSYGPVDLKYVAALARTTNSRNQVTAVGFSVTYDNNGNLTSDQNGYQRIYDAWNRLTFATGPGTPTTYTYDALGRNTTSIQCTGTGSDSYYSSSWQDLEDDSFVPAGSGGGHTAVASDQFVWGQGYVDDLVLRDHTPAGSGTTRLYAQQDANYNVTALVNTSGTVVQRFDYDPYGTATVLTAGWATTTDAYAWKYRFQGLAYDSNSGLYNGRNRTYSPTLGRWMQMDPAGYVDGMNLYQLTESAPTTLRDPMGLDSAPDDPLALPPYNPRGLTPWELSLANSDVVDKGIQVGLKLYSKKLISQVEDQLRSETDHYGFSQVDYLDLRGKLDGAAGPLAAHLWDEFQLSPLGNFETGVNNQVNQFLLSGFDTLGRDLLHLDSRPGNKAGDRADVHANITDTLFSSVFGDLRIEVCGYKAEAERTQRFFDQKNSSKDYIGYVGPELGFYWNLATQKNPPIRFTPSLGYDSSTQSIGGGIDASVDLLSLVPQLRNVPGLTSAKFGGDFFDINNKEKWDVKAELQFKF
ncbi:MAG TPA: RHS repeat-associated core domain-containing protein, partial [Tepidisphaeraceae bacterium]|nr:RHS repeat-associated core domain-containing protein [Tepidisphaeraceae bacterium]